MLYEVVVIMWYRMRRTVVICYDVISYEDFAFAFMADMLSSKE
jgi:hypothetical protein